MQQAPNQLHSQQTCQSTCHRPIDRARYGMQMHCHIHRVSQSVSLIRQLPLYALLSSSVGLACASPRQQLGKLQPACYLPCAARVAIKPRSHDPTDQHMQLHIMRPAAACTISSTVHLLFCCMRPAAEVLLWCSPGGKVSCIE